MKRRVTGSVLSLLLDLICTTSHAGFFSTTAHSRANCLTFNESVTWNARESHWWRVKSLHTSAKGANHLVDTFMAYTQRAAAYHVGESNKDLHDPWMAQGYHFYLDGQGREIYDAYTSSTDCSAYDGWWDK